MISLYKEALSHLGALVCMILSSLGSMMAYPFKVLFLPAVCTHWEEGLIQIRVTDNPISSTLNGLELRAALFPLL